MWFGYRTSWIVGSVDTPIGLATDVKVGASFGFGWEVGTDIEPGERDGMAYATAVAEGGIGPGFRVGPVDLMPTVGLGGEAVAWGTSDRDDDPYAEGYWYMGTAIHAKLDGPILLASFSRRFKERGLDNVFMTAIEAGVAFDVKDKKGKSQGRMSLQVWIHDYDTHLVAGLAIGTDAQDKKR